MPGDVSLWPNLTGGEAIDVLGRLRGGLDPARRAELLERFDLDPKKKARTYSKGNRQKVALVAALASDAELLMLDEPTSGLDPLMGFVFQDCIREVKAEGRTVLLSSHILAEVEALGDRVTIIRRGRAVESGTLSELRHITRTSISAETVRPPTGLAALPGVHNVIVEDHRVAFDVDTSQIDTAIRHLAEWGVKTLESHPPTLEELFLRHYGDELALEVSPNGDADPATRHGRDERARWHWRARPVHPAARPPPAGVVARRHRRARRHLARERGGPVSHDGRPCCRCRDDP